MIYVEGNIYLITHSRKGRFVLKVTSQRDTWVTGIIEDGHTATMLPENMKFKGEEVTLRKSLMVAEEYEAKV